MTTSFLPPFKNKTICENIPDVDYNPKWFQTTWTWNDFWSQGIKPQDNVFHTNSVVKFTDDSERSAIAMRYAVSCPLHHSKNDGYAVTALQKRHSDTDTWVFTGDYAHDHATPRGSLIDHSWLESLIVNGQEKFTNEFALREYSSAYDPYDRKNGDGPSIHSSSEYKETLHTEECTIILAGLQPNDTQHDS